MEDPQAGGFEAGDIGEVRQGVDQRAIGDERREHLHMLGEHGRARRHGTGACARGMREAVGADQCAQHRETVFEGTHQRMRAVVAMHRVAVFAGGGIDGVQHGRCRQGRLQQPGREVGMRVHAASTHARSRRQALAIAACARSTG